MSHDNYIIATFHNFTKCQCFYTCLYSCITFYLLGLTSIVVNQTFYFYNSLVSTTT